MRSPSAPGPISLEAPTQAPETRAETLVSDKSYATAVAISSVFGFLGLQHFYLGRIGEGLLDLSLSIGWMACFLSGYWLPGALFFVADWGHSTVVTIMLLTGNFRDGQGRLVPYPGQKLDSWRNAS
ncbi:MAG: TM2 domain-containing protein [Myxococcota bacterium]|nr:TM2 domain-containing protein [Myxococcota bacterium]